MRTDGILELIEHDSTRNAIDDLSLACKLIERHPNLILHYPSLEDALANLKRILDDLREARGEP